MVVIYVRPARAKRSKKPPERERMVVIAISGLHGAGKTTAALALVTKFNLKYICAGAVFRQLAEERGMTLDEFSRYTERHPNIDRKIDQRTAAAAKGKNVLIDARLAGWMAKRADLKILLTAPLEVRVRRIARRERREYGDALSETRKRELSEAKRFKRFYCIDVNDHSPFDLVLNTQHFNARETARILELAVRQFIRRRS
jgi:cytidylate kinase